MPDETLLIVEDNDILREGLKDMLTYEGFSVITARNGQEALAQMESVMPALILSDIMMPVMDGFEFYNAVRARPEWVSIPFVILTARSTTEDITLGKNLGVDDYLTKPISREELVAMLHSRLSRSRQVQVAQVQQAHLASLTALANAVDLRDMHTTGHIERVTDYSLALAAHLEWKEWQLEALRYGAILHDIGKISIPEHILFKKDALSKEEWEAIKSHPVIGAEMVKDVAYLTEIIPLILHHHERWDGAGYPTKISGEEIPEGARIIAVVDSFDMMTTERPYAPARSQQDAYLEILRLSGEKYDPGVVAAFQRAWYAGQIQSIATRR